ncbi:MAG: hypothetical protein ABIH76_05370 [Candidatus Bathyarchaeota archaeon]
MTPPVAGTSDSKRYTINLGGQGYSIMIVQDEWTVGDVASFRAQSTQLQGALLPLLQIDTLLRAHNFSAARGRSREAAGTIVGNIFQENLFSGSLYGSDPWRKTLYLSILRGAILAYEKNGSYRRELKDPLSAAEKRYGTYSEFQVALGFYECMFNQKSSDFIGATPSSPEGKLCNFTSGCASCHVYSGSPYNTNNYMVINNNSLFSVESSIPEEFLGWAGVLQSSLLPEHVLEDPYQHFDGDFEAMLGRTFNEVEAKIREAQNAYEGTGHKVYVSDGAGGWTSKTENYVDYVKDRLGYSTSVGLGRVLSERAGTLEADSITRIERKFKETSLRLEAAKADYLLRLAKRLRIANHDKAMEAVDLAIEYCLDILRKNPPKNPPEILLSTLLTLAWAYSSKAGLENDVEKGSGTEDALRAAAIYTVILYGPEDPKLKDDSKMLEAIAKEEKIPKRGPTGTVITKDGSPVMTNVSFQWVIDNVLGKKAGSLYFVRNSLERVCDGSSTITPWSGNIPTAVGKVDIDILAKLATNELELNLSLADSLRTAKRYSEAETEYRKIVDLDPSTEGKLRGIQNFRPTVFSRSRIGLSTTLNSMSTQEYWGRRDIGIAQDRLAKSLELTEVALRDLSGRLGTIQGKGNQAIYLQDYHSGILTAMDARATAYSSLGAIGLQEQGVRDENFERAAALYGAVHYFRGAGGLMPADVALTAPTEALPTPDEAARMDPRDVARINEEYLLYGANKAFLGLSAPNLLTLQVETFFTEDTLHFKRGMVASDLKDYETAGRELRSVRTHSNYFVESRVVDQDVEIAEAREQYVRAGFDGLDVAKENLGQTLREARGTLVDLYGQTSDRTLQLRTYQSIAGTYGTEGDIQRRSLQIGKAKNSFLQAASFYNKLLSQGLQADVLRDVTLPDELALLDTTGLLDDQVLEEMNLDEGELSFTLAEILRAAGDRDEEVLAAASGIYGEVAALSPDNNKRVRLGVMGSLGQVQAQVLTAGMWEREGRYQDVLASLQGFDQTASDALAVLRPFADSQLAARETHKALSTAAWLWGSIGGLTEKIEGEGKGKSYFDKAALVYSDWLGVTVGGVVSADAQAMLSNPSLLDELREAPSRLVLNYAELLRASAKIGEKEYDLDGLASAREAYRSAQRQSLIDASDPARFLREMPIIEAEARLGMTEVAMIQAADEWEHTIPADFAGVSATVQATEMRKKYEATKGVYNQAIQDVYGVLGDIPSSNRTLAQANLYVRATTSAQWANSGLAGILESDYTQSYDPLYAETAAALGLELLEEGQYGSAVAQQYVLEEKGLTKAELYMSVADGLVLARRFNDAKRALKDAEKAIVAGQKEGELTARVQFKRGDLYCWHAWGSTGKKKRERMYAKAQAAYEAGLSALDPAVFDFPFADNLRFEASMGRTKCLYELDDFEGAILEYKQAIESIRGRVAAETRFNAEDRKRLIRASSALQSVYVWAREKIPYIYNYDEQLPEGLTVAEKIDSLEEEIKGLVSAVPLEKMDQEIARTGILLELGRIEQRIFRNHEFGRGQVTEESFVGVGVNPAQILEALERAEYVKQRKGVWVLTTAFGGEKSDFALDISLTQSQLDLVYNTLLAAPNKIPSGHIFKGPSFTILFDSDDLVSSLGVWDSSQEFQGIFISKEVPKMLARVRAAEGFVHSYVGNHEEAAKAYSQALSWTKRIAPADIDLSRISKDNRIAEAYELEMDMETRDVSARYLHKSSKNLYTPIQAVEELRADGAEASVTLWNQLTFSGYGFSGELERFVQAGDGYVYTQGIHGEGFGVRYQPLPIWPRSVWQGQSKLTLDFEGGLDRRVLNFVEHNERIVYGDAETAERLSSFSPWLRVAMNFTLPQPEDPFFVHTATLEAEYDPLIFKGSPYAESMAEDSWQSLGSGYVQAFWTTKARTDLRALGLGALGTGPSLSGGLRLAHDTKGKTSDGFWALDDSANTLSFAFSASNIFYLGPVPFKTSFNASLPFSEASGLYINPEATVIFLPLTREAKALQYILPARLGVGYEYYKDDLNQSSAFNLMVEWGF